MKRLALAIGLAAVVAVMGLSTALAATTISAGNNVEDRTESDTWGTSYLVDMNTSFRADGEVTSWKIWAENTKQVQLFIYQHSGTDMATGWSVVGNSDVKTPVVGENSFELAAPITVKSGDFVGLHFPEDDGSVSFERTPADAPYDRGNLGGKVLLTSESASSSTAFVYSSDRIYSVKAFGTATDANGNAEDDKDKPEKEKDGINGNGQNFGTHLSGDEAGTDSQAQGQANFKLSKDGDSLKYKLNVANIKDVVSAGLYMDDDGTLVAPLYPATGDEDLIEGRSQGTLAEGTITENLVDLMAGIRDGKVYVAVFTEGSDKPEILGRLMAKGNGEDEAASVTDDSNDDGQNGDEENSEKVRGWEKHDNEKGNKENKGNKKDS